MARNLQSLFRAGSNAPSFFTGGNDDYYAQQRVSNENMRSQLGMAGLPDPTEKGPGALARIFGVLDMPGTAVRTAVHNIAAPDESDLDVWEELGKSWRGEERVTGSDILEEVGVENKWGRMVGGFVVDVLLDPVSYVTLGWSGAAKGAAKGTLGALARDIAKGGDIAAKYGDDIARIVSKHGGTLEGLGKAGSRELKEAVLRAGATGVDRGGVKIGLPLSSRGISVVPGAQKGLSKAAYGTKDALRSLPGSEWFERAFMHGTGSELTPVYRAGNEVLNAALDTLQRGRINTHQEYRFVADQMQRKLKAVVPDVNTRRRVSLAIAEGVGDVEQRARLASAFAGVKNASDDLADLTKPLLRAAGVKDVDEAISALGPTHEAVQQFVSKRAAMQGAQDALDTVRADVFDAGRIDRALAARITDPDELAKAREAAAKVEGWFGDLLTQQRQAGLEVSSLYGVPGRESFGFLPGISQTQLTKKEARKLAELLLDEGLDPSTLRDSGKLDLALTGRKRRTPAPEASKKYNTVLDRLQGLTRSDLEKVAKSGEVPEGLVGISTELDPAILLKRGAEKAGVQIGNKQYMDGVNELVTGLKQTDPQAAEDVLRLASKAESVLTDDEAVKGMLKSFDWALGKWKRWATAMNLPRFQARNWLSNQSLLWFDGLWDSKTMGESIEIIGKVVKSGGIVDAAKLTTEQRKIVDLATKHGVWQSVTDLMELTGTQAAQPTGRLVAAGGAVNQLVEMQGRLAGFMRAMNKGATPDAASEMVMKALYDYSSQSYTLFEQNVMMRLVPFYRWVKSNSVHLTDILAKRPGKLTAVDKLVRNAQDTNPIDTDVIPEWMRAQLPVPLPMEDKDGKTLVALAGGTFPLNELDMLAKAIANPKSVPAEAMAQLNPLIKVPIELITNRDLFYGDNVSRYPGDTRRAPGYIQQFDDKAMAVPGLSMVWSAMKDALGLVTKYDKYDNDEPYVAMNSYALKAVKDLQPWLNAMSKLLDERPEQVYDIFSYMTGTRVLPFDEERLGDQRTADMNTLLRDAVRKGRDEGMIPDAAPASLQKLFGGR